MVHPYLKRRQGLEPVSYPSKDLEAVLQRTLGVPLFQEQAMQIAIVGAGFTPPEADKLRRAMATFRRVGTIGTLKEKFDGGMIANGYDPEFAEASFSQIEGFGEYVFPESHVASLALLVYASSWVKCHYPDVFAAALLNAQPMGFYASAEIVRDAVEHGVDARGPDVNASHDQLLKENHLRWDSLGEYCALVPSFEMVYEKTKNPKAKVLAETLDKAVLKYLENGKMPSRKVGEIDNRGSSFYLALYWSEALASQNDDAELKSRFVNIYRELSANEKQIVNDLISVQGKPADIGGYYLPNEKIVSEVMRPSVTFYKIIDEM